MCWGADKLTEKVMAHKSYAWRVAESVNSCRHNLQMSYANERCKQKLVWKGWVGVEEQQVNLIFVK